MYEPKRKLPIHDLLKLNFFSHFRPITIRYGIDAECIALPGNSIPQMDRKSNQKYMLQ